VVDAIGLGGACEAEGRGGHCTGDDGGKSELLHFGAFFSVSASASLADLTA